MIGTLLVIGGGGFSTLDEASLIDDHLLSLTDNPEPKICFVPTASGDADLYSERFEKAFAGRARTSVLSLFCHDPWGYSDPAILLDQDIVYVGGGSTANLLAVWRLHGLPEILREAARNGTILAGISAGMNCWFDASSTDSYGPLAPFGDGLGFLGGSACPHYLEEPDRRDKYLGWVASGALPGGYAVDQHVALQFEDGMLVGAVAEREGHTAYHVERHGDTAVETELAVRTLAGASTES
ncbi:MAG: Type 1 glutamine amidotransferase-like domain-containing protein [Propionibacteriaceae bacterium]